MKTYLTRNEALRDALVGTPLEGDALRVAEIVWNHAHIAEDRTVLLYTGGCPPFYTPESWRERGEQYGEGATLIICHDGGALSDIVGPHHFLHGLHASIERELNAAGFYLEWCDSWYSRVAPIHARETP